MWTIVVKNASGLELSRTFVKPGAIITLGRAPECTIFLGTMTVSRQQGRIELRNGTPVFFDDESSTGTRIGNQYIRGPTRLAENVTLETGGFHITAVWTGAAPRPEPAAAAPAQVSKDWTHAATASGDMGEMGAALLQRVQGIRQHREQNQSSQQVRQSLFASGWTELLQSARRLQQQLAGDPRILAFAVSRDDQEILLKVREASSTHGYRSFILARRHPEGKYPEMEAVWLLELGQPEAFYSNPKDAMEEFVHRVAPHLA